MKGRTLQAAPPIGDVDVLDVSLPLVGSEGPFKRSCLSSSVRMANIVSLWTRHR